MLLYLKEGMLMSGRNVIHLQIDFNADETVTYYEAVNSLKQHTTVRELNMKYLLSIKELAEILDLTRVTIERNILENVNINTGVRHLDVTGANFPRTRIYIDAVDLIEYLVKYCDLVYWKKVKIDLNHYELRRLSNELITDVEIEYLARTIIERRLRSSKHIEADFGRSRRLVSRLNNIMDTITFAFPNSKRHLRRFVFSPHDNESKMEDYFRNYNVYESSIVKLIKD